MTGSERLRLSPGPISFGLFFFQTLFVFPDQDFDEVGSIPELRALLLKSDYYKNNVDIVSSMNKNDALLDNSQFKSYNIERLLQIRSFYLIIKEFFELHGREIQEKYNEESIRHARNLGIEEVLALDFKPFFMNLLYIDIRTTLEIYFNGVLELIFMGNIDVMKNSNKQYSTEEILFDDMDRLIEFLAEKEIRKFNENNSKDKIEYLKKLLNKKYIFNESLIDQFIEVSEIRNLLVHNEGRLNERFRKIVDNPKYKTSPEIIVNEEMLLEAIDSMIAFIDAIDKELCEKFPNISVYHRY